MKIGVFGGTFNPPHKTHVQIVAAAKAQLGLDRLFVLPCGLPPHKSCGTDNALRLEMTRLAFDGVAEVDDYEVNKQGKSYTVDTLRHYRQTYPDAELVLIIGGDSLRDFDTWHCPEEIAKLASLAVAKRGGDDYDAIAQNVRCAYGCDVTFLNTEVNSVSSTEIRLRYDFGMDCSDIVPQKVDEYVLAHGLYAPHAVLTSKLKGYLKPKRFRHTLYVTKRGLQVAAAMAQNLDEEKVFVACALHDCAKYIEEKDFKRYGFDAADLPKPVIHAFLGAKVAEMDFGVTDGEVLDAIAYHTTARPNMTELDMVVYIADKTEETRPYPTEHLFRENLTATFVETMKEANKYSKHKHADEFFDLTRQAMEFYLKDN